MIVNKILVVDDSATERFFFAELLSKNGYNVVTAENGAEAVTKAKSEQPDLILMDVVMPGQNGFQVTRTISRDPDTAHIPVIICTSKNQETDRYWGMKQGARDYLVKPVDPKDLLTKIRACES
jgi:twitching motility two-component system response regulator PilH